MDVYIGADHKGFAMKEDLMTWLQGEGHTVHDEGATTLEENDDYPDFGLVVARKVSEEPDKRRGVVICGSGVGMATAAAKVPGIRAALIHDVAIAKAARTDDNLNVVALGADYITIDQAKEVITAVLTTPFSGEERHLRRIMKISDYEENHS